jgi:hypothetical protein
VVLVLHSNRPVVHDLLVEQLRQVLTTSWCHPSNITEVSPGSNTGKVDLLGVQPLLDFDLARGRGDWKVPGLDARGCPYNSPALWSLVLAETFGDQGGSALAKAV